MTLLVVFTGLLLGAQIFTIGVLVFDGWRVRRNGRDLPPASANMQANVIFDAGNSATESGHLYRTAERSSRVAA